MTLDQSARKLDQAPLTADQAVATLYTLYPPIPTYTYLYLPILTYIDMDLGYFVDLICRGFRSSPFRYAGVSGPHLWSCHSGAEDPGAAILALFNSIALYFETFKDEFAFSAIRASVRWGGSFWQEPHGWGHWGKNDLGHQGWAAGRGRLGRWG